MLRTSLFSWENTLIAELNPTLKRSAIFAAAAAASVFSCTYTYVAAKFCMKAASDPLSPTVVKQPPHTHPIGLVPSLKIPGIRWEQECSLEL